MITRIHTAEDAKKALNENLEGILTGKRKLPMAKEVNNNIGKYISIVKFELMEKMRTGDKEPMEFFGGQKQLTNGV